MLMSHKTAATTLIAALYFLTAPTPSSALFESQVPLSLDVLNPDRSLDHLIEPYMIGMRRRIERRWFPREITRRRKARVSFSVMRDGSIVLIQIYETSGDTEFDESTLKAVEVSGPFPPSSMATLNILATFDNRYVDAQQLETNYRAYQLRQQRLTQQQQIATEQQERQPQADDRPSAPTAEREIALWSGTQSQPITSDRSRGQDSLEPRIDESRIQDQEPKKAAIEYRFEIKSGSQMRQLSPDGLNEYWEQLKKWLSTPYESRTHNN